MQSKRPNAVSRNPRTATENLTDRCTSHPTKPDTRRFAGIFPLEAPEAVSADCGGATPEEQDSEFDDPSQWEFISVLDNNTSVAQVASVASVDESSALSAAQEVIACYRAVHGGDHVPDSAATEIKEKGLPQIPDDQRSIYTLATPADALSTMDMMWRPKPKVHMCRTDQRALIQAQSQAIIMMHDAGLKPTNKIQCRRRGCADILPGVEALKYHLHIHNIADMAARCNDTSTSAACKLSLVECSTSNSKTSKRSHCRSKTSLGTQHSRSMTCSPPRKLSASDLLPSLFSSRESAPEIQHVSNLTTVAKAIVSDPSSSKSAVPSPMCNNETPFTHASTLSLSRRMRKESRAVSVGGECSPSIAMLLSPASSPRMRGPLVLTPHTNSSIPPALNPVIDGENDGCVFIPDENAHPVSEKFTRSRNPMRALSPTRAMSPIRNGIRRVLSIGYAVDFTDE